MDADEAGRPDIALVTVIGLALLIGPLATMAHEISGHGVACLALGGHLREIGAYYVDCTGTAPVPRRLVAMAGTAIDLLLFVLCHGLWRSARGDLARLTLWLLFTVKGMVAAGYWLFSGVLGLGDWGPGPDGGIGPLAYAPFWRIGLSAIGLVAYIGVVRLSLAALRTMLGGGEAAFVAQKRIALGFYGVNGAVALLVGLVNPHGLFITMASAAASSFGGTAGLFNIAYARSSTPPRPFIIRPSLPILLAGLIVAIAFGAILGPTVYP